MVDKQVEREEKIKSFRLIDLYDKKAGVQVVEPHEVAASKLQLDDDEVIDLEGLLSD